MRWIKAVEIGSSGVRTALVGDGQITDGQQNDTIKTPRALMEFVATGLPEAVTDIAYSVAGDIRHHSFVALSPNQPWLSQTNLVTLTKQVLNRRSVVGNDMETAALGMSELFKDIPFFRVITWSGGIGERVVKDGQVISDSEVGHILLDPGPFADPCGCGKRGCAEAIIGGVAAQAKVRAFTSHMGISIPASYKWPTQFLDACYEKHEPWAIDFYTRLIDGMARLLGILQTALWVPTIIWKGGMARGILYEQNQAPSLLATMQKYVVQPSWADIRFQYGWKANVVKDADSLLGCEKLSLQHFQDR